MSSVWVCRYLTDKKLPAEKCFDEHIPENVCLVDGNPCDAVEYAPVKRGRWSLKKPSQTDMPEGFKNILAIMGDVEVPECSECKSLHKNKTTYCPSCGARMGDE